MANTIRFTESATFAGRAPKTHEAAYWDAYDDNRATVHAKAKCGKTGPARFAKAPATCRRCNPVVAH